jgi:ribonuclease P protein component
MSASFAQHERIKRKSDFQRVYTQGKKRVSSSFILYCTIDSNRKYRRLGITASKKVGNAVTRNRCKRIVREVFRRNKELFLEGTDVVVIVRRDMVGKRYDSVLEEFYSILRS